MPIVKYNNIIKEDLDINSSDSIRTLFNNDFNVNKENIFIEDNSIIFKKYRFTKKLVGDSSNHVYIGYDILTKRQIAIKIESRKSLNQLLQNEAFTLFNLNGLGIPNVQSSGKIKNYNILIMPLLGKSLFYIFYENEKKCL